MIIFTQPTTIFCSTKGCKARGDGRMVLRVEENLVVKMAGTPQLPEGWTSYRFVPGVLVRPGSTSSGMYEAFVACPAHARKAPSMEPDVDSEDFGG